MFVGNGLKGIMRKNFALISMTVQK